MSERDAGEQQVVKHIVAIADPGDVSVYALAVFGDCHQIRRCLTGMVQVREGVDYWYSGMFGQFLRVVVPEAPVGDSVEVPREDCCSVGDRFALTELDIIR